LILFVGNIIAWGYVDLTRVNIVCIPILVALLILCAVVRSFSTTSPSLFLTVVREEWKSGYARKKAIDLELAIERKRLSAASFTFPPETRRHIYKESAPAAIEQYRSEGLHYRRIHNAFQSVIIIGSLATSTAASLAETPAPYKRLALLAISSSASAVSISSRQRTRSRKSTTPST
jgi:hypothetical protein